MRGHNCKTCLRACKNFPLKSVVEFESRGSSSSNAKLGRMYGLDVCLERAQIESIIESRQGGHELLRSEDRLLLLLGSGEKQYKFSSDEGDSLYMVKYKQEELDEIKRVIAYAEIDVKKISSRTISSAIMRSFSRNGSKVVPPQNQRYLSDESLEFLVDKIGLSIDKEDFAIPLAELMKYTQQIGSFFSQGFDEDGDRKDYFEHEDIEMECLKLIRRFLETSDNPPIQQIASSQAISLLGEYLDLEDKYKIEAANCLRIIFARGTDMSIKR